MMTFECNKYQAWQRSDANMHSLFSEEVARHPEALAIVDGERSLSYAELDRLSTSLAAYLMHCGVKPHDAVGIYMPKSSYYVIACLGALKAGCAYFHMDVAYTAGVLSHTLREVSPVHILTTDAAPALPGVSEAALTLLDRTQEWQVPAVAFRPPRVAPESTAIIGYTSGTTGKPKGVMVSHRAAIYAFCKFWEEIEGIKDRDRFGYVTYTPWDALSPLLFGATGVIVPDAAAGDLEVLVGCFDRYGINHTFFTPSLLRQLLESFPPAYLRRRLQALRVLWLGGEVVQPDLLVDVLSALPEAAVFNNYGPTECFVVSQGRLTLHDGKNHSEVAAGRILPELKFVLADDKGKDVTAGGRGYLYVAGPALASGYVKRPDLTQSRFVSLKGELYYATGDYCYLRADGQLCVLGRDQDLVIGKRPVVLTEVERALKAMTGLRDCVVIADQSQRGRALVFWVAGASKKGPSDEAVGAIVARYFASFQCFEVPEIPRHPVSQKRDYLRLLRSVSAVPPARRRRPAVVSHHPAKLIASELIV